MPFPAPSMKRPPPHDAKRSALAAGPGKAWQYYTKFYNLALDRKRRDDFPSIPSEHPRWVAGEELLTFKVTVRSIRNMFAPARFLLLEKPAGASS